MKCGVDEDDLFAVFPSGERVVDSWILNYAS